MPSIRKITNNCITIKIFILSRYGLKAGALKSGAFLKLLSVVVILESIYKQFDIGSDDLQTKLTPEAHGPQWLT